MGTTSATSTIRQPKKQRAFLAAYAELGTVLHAAEAAGINRCTHNAWLADPVYAEAFEEAKEAAAERLEREAIRRAVEGVEKPVYQGGQMVGTIREYSDTLLIFTLKGLRPEKYRERFQVSVITEDAIDAEIRRLHEELARREAGEAAGAAAPPG